MAWMRSIVQLVWASALFARCAVTVKLQTQVDANDTGSVEGSSTSHVLWGGRSTLTSVVVDRLVSQSLHNSSFASQVDTIARTIKEMNLPIDGALLGKLLTNPQVIQGLLSGDLTTPLISLSKKTVAPTSNQKRTTDLLKGHSLMFNNVFVVVIVCVLVVMPACGILLDRLRNKDGKSSMDSSPISWQLGMLMIASYLIWIPAIFSKDFSLNIGFIIPMSDARLGITLDEHNGNKEGPMHESTRSLMKLLWHTGAHAGAYLIAIYAFAVPVFKVFLLALGEHWRFSPCRWKVQVARISVKLMQYISKWAAPDMFAYVLLYHLLRTLQNLPISTLVLFDIGFTCYSVFTLTCAISSAAVPLPELPPIEGEVEKEPSPPLWLRIFRPTTLPALVVPLFVTWAVLFVIGVGTPCFSLALETKGLLKSAPANMKMILHMIKLEKIVPGSNVSIWRVTCSMLEWLHVDGDLNFMLAFIMLFVFVMAFTVFDMVCLLVTALQVRHAAQRQEELGSLAADKHPCIAIRSAWVLKKLSMLDVLIVGVVVCTQAGAIYAAQGFSCAIERGLYILIAAEAIHYVAYYMVESIAHHYVNLAAWQGKQAGLIDKKAAMLSKG